MMTLKDKPAQIFLHLAGSLVYLSIPLIFWPGEGGLGQFFSDFRAFRGYINHFLILLFFYLNFYLLIPRLYFQKKYLIYSLVLMVCLMIITFLPHEIMHLGDIGPVPPKPRPGGPKLFFLFNHNLVFFLTVVFFSLLIKINNRWKQAEREKLKAELSFFKAQINPHFLFNTLNTIYSLAIQQSENTADAIVKLSGMMRYILSDASQDFVALDKEISYINDYIDLQKLRYGETVEIDYVPSHPGPGMMIAPLVLIPFIENAFKFGINPEKKSHILINMQLVQSDFHLHVFNEAVSMQDDIESVSGLGINNTRQRLSLLYPDKHKLVIDNSKSGFTVDLYISLA